MRGPEGAPEDVAREDEERVMSDPRAAREAFERVEGSDEDWESLEDLKKKTRR